MAWRICPDEAERKRQWCRRALLSVVVNGTLDRSYGEGKLWFRGRVVGFVAAEESRERQVKVFGSVGPTGIWLSIQHKGLRHVAERGFRSLSLDLSSAAVVAAPDPAAKRRSSCCWIGLEQLSK
jgi:hypothetical protein